MAQAEDKLSGENEYAIGEYAAYEGRIFEAKLLASLSDEYIGAYSELAESRLALTLNDWRGQDSLTAYIDRASPDGAALAELLSGGGTAKVTLRIKLTPSDSGRQTARIVEFVSDNWLDTDGYSPELFEAVRSGSFDEVVSLYSGGASLSSRDENGDGLVFHALRGGDTELAGWLIGSGADCLNRNCYYSGYDYLTDFEMEDTRATIGQIVSAGGSVGCAYESLLGYFVTAGRDSAVEFLLALNNFDPNAHALSQYNTRLIAQQYGIAQPENSHANVLDAAVANNNVRIAKRLLESGIQPSPLLLAKIAQGMDFSSQMTALLGDYRFFGLLDSVAEEYRRFREGYSPLTGDLYGFTDMMEEYSSLYSEGQIFDANFLFSTELTPAAEKQAETFEELAQPSAPEILAIYDSIAEYITVSNRAAHQLRLVNESMTKSARNIHFAQYDALEQRAAELRLHIDDTVKYYDTICEYLF